MAEATQDASASSTTAPASQSQASPELHAIQLRYKLASTTMKTLATIKEKPDRRVILEKACLATEFRSFPIKQAERGFFRHVNDHTPIPFMIRETVTQPHHKVFLLVQIDLQRDGWPNKLSGLARKDLQQEKGKMYAVLERALRCLIDILGERLDGTGVSVGLDVLRSIKSGVWEGGDNELCQVQGVGPVNMRKLNEAGIKTIKELSKMEFYHIERLLTRNPPFGQNMLHFLSGFPILTIGIDVIDPLDDHNKLKSSVGESSPGPKPNMAWAVRFDLGFDNDKLPHWKEKTPWATLTIVDDRGGLVWFWRGSMRRLEGGKSMVVRLGARQGQKLSLVFACEGIVGTTVRENLCF